MEKSWIPKTLSNNFTCMRHTSSMRLGGIVCVSSFDLTHTHCHSCQEQRGLRAQMSEELLQPLNAEQFPLTSSQFWRFPEQG